MSYTTPGEHVTFIHNGDFSGDLTIVVDPDMVKEVGSGGFGSTVLHVTIPFEDVKMLVASYVRDRNISALEQASDDDVLFMEWSVTDG